MLGKGKIQYINCKTDILQYKSLKRQKHNILYVVLKRGTRGRLYMKCPYCTCNETKVTDSRESSEEPVTRRRRECPKCKKRFTTYERLETSNVIVVKKDGRREQFDREKLRRGLLRACEKRPIPQEKIDAVISDIEADITSSGKTEIASRIIGEKIMSVLKKLDKVAYIRFASVYREFTDLETFQEELKMLLKKQRGKNDNAD